MFDWHNKWYLIAGGSSGIGFASAQFLCSKGAHVVLVSHNQHKLDLALGQLPQGNLAICADLKTPATVDAPFLYCEKHNILLDGMLYAAGVSPLCLLRDQTPELISSTFNLNLFSFLEMSKYFYLSQNAKDGASIVGIASIAATGAGYRQTVYGSSKAAMISAAKLMSNELWNRKMRINTISPGVVDTPMLQELAAHSEGLLEKLQTSQKLGVISPTEIAQAVAYLLSDAAAHITGTNFVLDGGAALK